MTINGFSTHVIRLHMDGKTFTAHAQQALMGNVVNLLTQAKPLAAVNRVVESELHFQPVHEFGRAQQNILVHPPVLLI